MNDAASTAEWWDQYITAVLFVENKGRANAVTFLRYREKETRLSARRVIRMERLSSVGSDVKLGLRERHYRN